MPEPVIIATWPFGKTAAESGLKSLASGDAALDAALVGAQAVEDDYSIRTSVGFGSLPDRLGRLTLDACVMDGKTLSCGGVACVEHIKHPAALARRVMEKTPHVLLVGDGAKWFALQQGFPLEVPYTAESIKEWLEKHPDLRKKIPGTEGRPPVTQPVRYEDPSDINVDEHNHDTVTVLALDKKGNLGGVCTTSGLAFKLPGRVGDSPLIGSGLYVDDEAGAAGATGVGEEIIRIGGSFFVVEQMRNGKTAQEACEVAVRRVNATAGRRGVPRSRSERRDRRCLHCKDELPLRDWSRRQNGTPAGQGDWPGCVSRILESPRKSCATACSSNVKDPAPTGLGLPIECRRSASHERPGFWRFDNSRAIC